MPPRRRTRWRRLTLVFALLAAALVGARLALPKFVRDSVNRTLDRNPLYDGRIGDVSLHLWRGAYSIEEIRLVKTTGTVPVPFFAARRIDLALDTRALMSGKLVGHVKMESPELNFVDSDDASKSQTGAGGPWLQTIRDLFPFDINGTEIEGGSVHFRAFGTDPPVDVYLTRLVGSIENLTNVHDDITPMFSTVSVQGLAMDDARFEYAMKLDPFSYRPTFQLAVRLIGLDITKTNALARAYGNVDFESGWFDLVVELDVKEGRLEGYVKPLFRDLEVFDLARDARANIFLVFWEALVGAATNVFKNQSRDQVATVIPMHGELSAPSPDFLATISNVLRNAFVRAYLPRLQGIASEVDELTFEPGSIFEPDAAPTKD
ncbi:MAG TPA: DUF748 domain-containing protein [Planctomycetota bacterium]|nr:DUF748 domain-containing protein [Planctomycetota bacterium]